MTFDSINPATLERLNSWPALSSDEVIARVETAGAATADWAALGVSKRCEHLRAWGDELRRQLPDLAALATAEMGKPIKQSRAEVEKCATALAFVADQAPAWLADDRRNANLTVRFDPLGVLIGVMPWNFPFWQIVRFAAGALAAGNTVLIKPAPNTVGCALALETSATAAGFHPGVVSILLSKVEDLEPAVAHDAVAGVSLTGSVRAGRSFAAVAARYGKPAVLELGGSDPFVVLDDADIATAARQAAASRTLSSGQSCIAAKRFIAVDSVYDAFRDAFVEAMRDLKVGNPALDETDVGPMARKDLLDTLIHQRDSAIAAGGKALLGCELPTGPGYYFPQEIVEIPSPTGRAWREETFGPLAALIRARDEEHAVSLANHTTLGLGASLWTADAGRGQRLAASINAGSVFINGIVRSDPSAPFGGVKASGYGRELGIEGVRQFTNVKTVWTESGGKL